MNSEELKQLVNECLNEVFIERGGYIRENTSEALRIALKIWEHVYHVQFAEKSNDGISYRVLVGGPFNMRGMIRQSPCGGWSAYNNSINEWVTVDEVIEEMSMTQGGPGGEGYLTKYAFSRRDKGNPEAAETLGYKMVDTEKKKRNHV